MKHKKEIVVNESPKSSIKAPGANVYLSKSAKRTYDILRVDIGAHGYAETLELVLEKLNTKQHLLKQLFKTEK